MKKQEQEVNSNQDLDVRSLMRKLREDIRERIKDKPQGELPHQPYVPDPQAMSRKAGELFHSEDLRALNLNHAYSSAPNLDSIVSHRTGGIQGKIGAFLVKVKRKIALQLWNSIMRDYFQKEKEFATNLVRYLNQVSSYTDARDASIFYELIRKIDVDTGRAVERADRFKEEFSAELSAVEQRIYKKIDENVTRHVGELQANAVQDRQRLAVLESVASGLESLVARAFERPAQESKQVSSPNINADPRYVILENRFRGSKEVIQARVAWYADYLFAEVQKSTKKKILDIGCGRGELLAALKQKGIEACGVDMDGAMLAEAQERGLEVTLENALEFLCKQPDNSFFAATAIQVIEHLTTAQNEQLLRELRRVLVPGGLIMFETINPCSMLALSSNYFRDPTHVWPQHPDTAAFLASLIGFETVEVKMLSPVPEGFQAHKINVDEYANPEVVTLVEKVNYNFSRLNEIMFGYQDYCLIARKR